MTNRYAALQTLPKGYEPWWAEIADHLGGIYPFQDESAPGNCSLDLGDIIASRRARGEPVALDSAALAVKATHLHLFGNRTLLQNVQRAPWMAHPDTAGNWHPTPLPKHGQDHPDPEQFIFGLKNALLREAEAYVQNAGTVGILLSGGMDSRVLAGVIRALQEEAGHSFNVVGLTWGFETSRDVIYARRITEQFGWEWQHYPITAETLAENIGHTGHMGAEVSPLHLHAMPDVARTDGLDVVLAGSYGDSVGRAEFAGRRLTRLRAISPKHLDRFGVLKNSTIASAKSVIAADVIDTPHIHSHTSPLRQREIEQEMHYMRRMLQTCMLSIAKKRPLYQLFTAPDVFGQMWALDPSIRNDEWYMRLLPHLPGNLLDIPWARTGRRFGHPEDTPDQYSNGYHLYGPWLRGELRTEVLNRIHSERIRNLGVFNERGLDRALQAWKRASTTSTNSLDELVSWLASLHDFLEYYQIEVSSPIADHSWRDRFSAIRGGLNAHAYIGARERLRD